MLEQSFLIKVSKAKSINLVMFHKVVWLGSDSSCLWKALYYIFDNLLLPHPTSVSDIDSHQPSTNNIANALCLVGHWFEHTKKERHGTQTYSVRHNSKAFICRSSMCYSLTCMKYWIRYFSYVDPQTPNTWMKFEKSLISNIYISVLRLCSVFDSAKSIKNSWL